ncbi:hypothetical protein BLNAU_9656 [Blattamonas nauphoetae]|uniref:Uncharacterized protein n=1 Tax=Blattamonas nauphoetae TaxID=2049346 RepID=A0ABQ9XVB5_9EUKA|nr:hypothetical protein BLNAU_9656 [Blattamonas nauphoetae]
MFDISLFDEADDQKVVASLRRCHAVLEATQSTDCIVDVGTFRTFLISGLHSSNFVVQMECHYIFFDIADFLPTVDDPRDSKFQSLRSAFRDGSYYELISLLELWVRWFDNNDRDRHGHVMVESDFDFDGLLNADLSDKIIFDYACDFVGRIITNNAVLMLQPWRLDFLHSFEKRHQMMSRLSSDPSPSSKLKRSTHYLSPLALTLGSLLSVFRGCDFPSTLTELITTDLDSSNLRASQTIFPAFFLNYTSIDPKHRHSFFPMDLMFERYLRSDPDSFIERWADVSACTSRKFLHTSYVGLHSLLLRSPKLNLDEQSLDNLLQMLFITSLQDTPQAIIVNLFGLFPPPRLFDTLLSPPHLVRARIDIWTDFLFLFGDIIHLTAPFGACSSLAKVFQMLAPFVSNKNQFELDLMWMVGDVVVSLHWFSIPAHFDSPLLCHLPSLAGAQRGVLQTLSSHSGIPSLATPLTARPVDDHFSRLLSSTETIHEEIGFWSMYGLHLAAKDFNSTKPEPHFVEFLMKHLLSPFPAVVSIAIEFFHRFVSVSSDAVRIELVKKGLLDRVVFAVSNSSFLDDYEKGIAVIGILLDTIRRDI